MNFLFFFLFSSNHRKNTILLYLVPIGQTFLTRLKHWADSQKYNTANIYRFKIGNCNEILAEEFKLLNL